jgi:hypothetical protein
VPSLLAAWGKSRLLREGDGQEEPGWLHKKSHGAWLHEILMRRKAAVKKWCKRRRRRRIKRCL